MIFHVTFQTHLWDNYQGAIGVWVQQSKIVDVEPGCLDIWESVHQSIQKHLKNQMTYNQSKTIDSGKDYVILKVELL